MSKYEKYNLKIKGLKLEKEDPKEAIRYYNDLINHDYFINDYFVYKRLVLLYKKTKEPENLVNIIRDFFKSDIYCNKYHYLWFRNKLRIYSKEGYITTDEISELTDYFKEHGCKNKFKSNTPLPIADRIIKKRGEAIIESEYQYDKIQKEYELEEECREFKRQGKINEAIDLYNHMIDDLGFRRYRFFQSLCIAYRQINDLENELRIIDKYFDGDSTRTKLSNEWFNNRENEVMDLLGAKLESNNDKLDKLFNDDEYIKEISENAKLFDEIEILKKRLNTVEENLSKLGSKQSIFNLSRQLSYLKQENNDLKQQINKLQEIINFNDMNFTENASEPNVETKNTDKFIKTTTTDDNKENTKDKQEYSREISEEDIEKNLNFDFKPENYIKQTNNSSFEIIITEDLEKEIENCILYEYKENLTLEANLIRKVILKEHGRFLSKNKRYQEAINFYNDLKYNSYFKNDWYPYRQLTMIYEKTAEVDNNINNIKELFLSGIYLNGYQYIWFTNKLRILIDHDKYANKIATYNKNEIQSWLNYYEEKSNENKLKQNKYPADRFTKKNNILSLLTEEQFNLNQKSYEQKQITRINKKLKKSMN